MVRPGYKHTEVGVIPEDWKTEPLGPLVIINSGESPSQFFFSDEGTPYFKVEQLNNDGKYLRKTPYFVRSSKSVPGGSIIFPKRGASIFLNKVRILGQTSFMDTNLMTLMPKDSLHNEYLYYFILNIELWRIADITSVPQINNKHINPLVIPIPEKKIEQEYIAKVLSDIDALIESLERLIAKKRDIKQAAMMQILDPGSAWVKKRLGDTSIIKARIGWQGLTTAEYLDSGNYLLITGTDFQNGFIDWYNCHYVNEGRYLQDRHIQLKQHDILVTKDGTIGKVAFVDELQKPATLNSGIFVVRPIDGAFEPELFYHLLQSAIFSKFLDQLSAGSTINHLYQKDFVNFEYQIPETLSEQKNIAATLTAMDKEIAAINQRLEKARKIKQGMMQELLTGRIRLI